MRSAGPLPVLDLSSHGMIACVGMAARQHVVAAEERPRAPRSSEHLAWAAERDRVCLYCSSPAPCGGEEHVLSVALGNWFWVIPPDVVCRTCNNEVLSVLDTELGKHPFIALMRTLHGVQGRKGQPPEVRASNVGLTRDRDGTLHVATNHERHVHQSEDELRTVLSWQNVGPAQRRVFARALLKIGLGILWLGRGPSETALPRYDHVRDAIRGDKRVPLRYGFANSELPGHALKVMAVGAESTPGILVSLDYFGIHLWAQSAGYREDADAEFLAKEIDVEFAKAGSASELPRDGSRG